MTILNVARRIYVLPSRSSLAHPKTKTYKK